MALALAAGSVVATVLTTAASAGALPACKKVMAHGGYTDDPGGAVVRQPNFTKAIDTLAPAGVEVFEVDVQLTKMSTSNTGWAFMWHNATDNGLDGERRNRYVGNMTWTSRTGIPPRGPGPAPGSTPSTTF